MERDGHLEKEPEEELDDVEEDPLANVLCIKCGKSLSDMANIREAIVGPEPEPPSLVCHGYRLLLASSCVVRDHLDRSRGCGGACARLLELCYETTRPTDPSRKAAHGFPNLRMPSSSRLGNILIVCIALRGAKRSKWQMMIGGVSTMARKCSRESDEAKLFWSLLDESHGGDFLRFYLYCNELIQTTAGVVLNAQGCVFANTYYELKEKVKEFESHAKMRKKVGANPADPPWDRLAAISDADALGFRRPAVRLAAVGGRAGGHGEGAPEGQPSATGGRSQGDARHRRGGRR